MSTILKVSEPLIRITEMAPLPAVAKAHMVVSPRIISLPAYSLGSKIENIWLFALNGVPQIDGDLLKRLIDNERALIELRC